MLLEPLLLNKLHPLPMASSSTNLLLDHVISKKLSKNNHLL
jgi:hypothetical protein